MTTHDATGSSLSTSSDANAKKRAEGTVTYYADKRGRRTLRVKE